MKFAALKWYSVAVFLGLWAVVAWGDLQHQKVRHGQLRFGVWAAALGYLVLVANTACGVMGWTTDFHYWGFYQAIAGHLFLCVSVGVALWMLRVWPAGDAKLFSFLALLYPLLDPTGSFPHERLFLVVLINTFIPAAVFLFGTAVFYVFNTRLRSGRAFFAELGWRKELQFLEARFIEGLEAVKTRTLFELERLRGLDWRGAAGAAWALAVYLAPQLLQWLVGMLFMSLVSYYLKDFFKSPVLLSILCVGMFLLWNQARQILGQTLARAALLAGAVALFWWKPPTNWDRMAQILGSLSVFSFCMFLGMNAAMGMLSGRWGWFSMVVMPFVTMFLMWGVMRLWALARWCGAYALDWTGRVAAAGHGAWRAAWALRPGPEFAERAQASGQAAWFGTQSALSGLSNPYVGTMIELSLMGVFFGLSLVLVKLWDDEVRPTHRAEALASNLLLAPSFVDRLKEDEEFFDEHFQSLYADGLTFEQAEALKGWCARNGVAVVPLAPTMSFASWIFFGYFLSFALGGRSMLEAVL